MPSAPNKLLEGPILRSLLTLAVPIVTANVLQSAYQIIDAFWVGRLGGAAVAAVSISFPVRSSPSPSAPACRSPARP